MDQKANRIDFILIFRPGRHKGFGIKGDFPIVDKGPPMKVATLILKMNRTGRDVGIFRIVAVERVGGKKFRKDG